MKSLFTPADNEEIVNRVNNLTATTQPQWGKMNVEQMVTHCQRPLMVAFGELNLKRGLPGILFGSFVKKRLLKDEQPFGKNLPTDPNFIVKDERLFNAEKEKLVSYIKQIGKGPSAIKVVQHPFFGKMTPQDWDKIMYKHLDHHLRQFGA
jgi:hypothetical protein